MSLEKVLMPKLGESVTEGTVTKWLVKVGDKVEQFDTLLEVETAKVVAEVPSTVSGVITEILVKEGETVAVGVQICSIEVAGGVTSPNSVDTTTTNVTTNISNETKTLSAISANQKSSDTVKTLAGINNKNNRYSPAVLALANEHNINLSELVGSGENNRVTRKDLLAIIEGGSVPSVQNTTSNTSTEKTNNTISSHDFASSDYSQNQNGDKIVPLNQVRKVIAKKMLQSVTEIPHAWMAIEVDATNLVKLREKVKSEFMNNEGFPITYFTFFVHEIVKALKKFPLLNSVWGGDHIIIKKDINVSIAVASGKDLFVPVIKNADSKNIKGLASDIYNLAHKAKNGKLTTSDIEGGTFTINNTGSFGSVKSMGIINHPQAAILQVEAIKKRPVVINDEFIAIRDMVNLCISIDHRILDGLEVGKFLAEVKHNIENITI
ncbi:dihydrolipoamide acetyltransferase family protein [Rickettsiales bacterium LUAb2]